MNYMTAAVSLLVAINLALSLATDDYDFTSYLEKRATLLNNERSDIARLERSVHNNYLDDWDRVERALIRLEKQLLAENLGRVRDTVGHVYKRKSAFWQPMGGPLPVETRFVSFGNRKSADEAAASPSGGMKAMRYGRRR
jgi:hypothetical protein